MTASNGSLPEGLLIHIGPPKTGTSTVQAAFHLGRREILGQGVRYVGRSRHPGSAVLAVTGRRSFRQDAGPPPLARWQALVDEVRAASEPRVVVSSEFFANAGPREIARILADLRGMPVSIVVTLRPLSRLVASQWQQYVQSGFTLPYDRWLHAILDEPDQKASPSFWLRHRHDELVDRWAAAVGPDRVTVVVVDDADDRAVLRDFERLTGLRDGTLTAPGDRLNRSLTRPEVEAVRAFNAAYRETGLGRALYHSVMHFGAAQLLKARTPEPDEPRIATPSWAIDRCVALARTMVERIGASGVRVVGDLEGLARAPAPATADGDANRTLVPRGIGAALAMGIIVSAGHARGCRLRGGTVVAGRARASELDAYRAERLARYLLRRVVLGAGRRLSDLAGVDSPRERSTLDPAAASPDERAVLAELGEACRRAGLDGRLDRLLSGAPSGEPLDEGAASELPETVSPEVVGDLGVRLLFATGLARLPRRRTAPVGGAGQRDRARPSRWGTAEPPPVAVVSSPQLARVLMRRVVGESRQRAVASARSVVRGRGPTRISLPKLSRLADRE